MPSYIFLYIYYMCVCMDVCNRYMDSEAKMRLLSEPQASSHMLNEELIQLAEDRDRLRPKVIATGMCMCILSIFRTLAYPLAFVPVYSRKFVLTVHFAG